MELNCIDLSSENSEYKWSWKEFQNIPYIRFPIFFIIPQNLCIENRNYNAIGSKDIARDLFEKHINEFMDCWGSDQVLVWDEYGFKFSDTDQTKVEEVDINDIIVKKGLNEFYPNRNYEDGLRESIINDKDIADNIATIAKNNPNTKFYLIYAKKYGHNPEIKIWRIRNSNTIFLHNGTSNEEYCGLSDEDFYRIVSKRNLFLYYCDYNPYYYVPKPQQYYYIESCLQLDFNSQNLEIIRDTGQYSLKRCEDHQNGKCILYSWTFQPLRDDFMLKKKNEIQKKRREIRKRDNKINFDEASHTYIVEGKTLQSVTNIVENCFPKFDAQLHAKTTAAKTGMTEEEVIAMWERKGKESRELGTAMHQKIESYYQGKHPYEDDAFKLFKVFADKVKLEPYRTEWAVYDTEYNIAGTIDFVDYQDGKYTIYDWKRSDKIIANGMPVKVSKYQEKGLYPLEHLENCAYYHYALQLSLYKFILEKNYDIKVSDLRLGIFHPSYDKPYVLKMPYLENEVKTLMELRSEVIL